MQDVSCVLSHPQLHSGGRMSPSFACSSPSMGSLIFPLTTAPDHREVRLPALALRLSSADVLDLERGYDRLSGHRHPRGLADADTRSGCRLLGFRLIERYFPLQLQKASSWFQKRTFAITSSAGVREPP